jgi:predicted transcriptional regulator
MAYAYNRITILSTMKTVTIKADAEFDALLSRLAGRLSTTRSRVIRDAVRNYQKYLNREELRQKIQSASLKTREQALEASADFDVANTDGL